MSNGRQIAFKYANGNRDLRVSLEQARAVKAKMLKVASGSDNNPYMTVTSDIDGEAFFDVRAVYGLFVDKSPKYVPADKLGL